MAVSARITEPLLHTELTIHARTNVLETIERAGRIGGLRSIAAVCTSGKRPTREPETEREVDNAIRDALGRWFLVVLNVPSSWLILPCIDPRLREGAGGMVFRTVSAIAALMICVAASGGEALAQYYPPAQAYPPPQAYPPQGYYPRQGYRPRVVDEDDDDDMIYDLEGRPLPPGAVAKSQPNKAPGRPYPDGRQRSYHDLPLRDDEDYEPYYGVPGGIPPGKAGSAAQDAIRREAMRSRVSISPDQIGPGSDDPRVTGSIGGGDPTHMAAFPPDVRPETGPKKELPPQFRRTLVDYPTKEAAGTIIVDTPNTYLYLVLGNGKALRYGIGVGREGFTWSGVQQVTKMAEWPDWNPPEEMIVRQPYLPRFMAGGETNPLGARALYLGKTVYRIHGTNQPSTIGTFVSSGCIRLTNEDVMDLYSRVKVGTRVLVLPARPSATVVATVRDDAVTARAPVRRAVSTHNATSIADDSHARLSYEQKPRFNSLRGVAGGTRPSPAGVDPPRTPEGGKAISSSASLAPPQHLDEE
jgi:lipoprotein-anchoring transpeptidase ErfK/SrfK